MSTKGLRHLEREYRTERQQILDDEGRSWEAKMRAVKKLFERYASRRGPLSIEEEKEAESAWRSRFGASSPPGRA